MPTRRTSLALAAAALASASLPRLAAAQTQTVRIATTIAESFAVPLFADELGFYKKAGINVEITQYSGGEPSETAVITGNADIGVTTPIQLANAFVHDVPLRLIGWCGQYNAKGQQPAIFVTKDSPLKTPQDLVGKTIGVNALGTMNFLGVAAWLSKNGIDVKQVRAVEVPFPAINAALQRGTIDAGVMAEPYITNNGDSVRLFAPAFEVMGPHWSISCWFARLDYIRSHRPLIKRMMDIAYDTGKYVNAHHEASDPVIAKYSKIPLQTVTAMRHTDFAEGPAPDSARIELDYAFQFNLLPRRVTVEQLMAT